MAEELGEKTEQPTGKRLTETRNKGQVAKSQDLTGAILLAGAVLLAFFLFAGVFNTVGALIRYSLSTDGLATDLVGGRLMTDSAIVFLEAARVAVPIMLLMIPIAVFATGSQVGLLFTLQPLKPNLARLNVVKGVSKLFSKRSAMKAAIDILKLALIAVVAFIYCAAKYERLLALPALAMRPGFLLAVWLVFELAIWVLLVLFVLGIIDYVYQKWQHTQDLKMTKHEVKDERKSMEGDPEMKGRRLRLARQMAVQRINQSVPQADVVVTNPTHYSVAIQYDADAMNAPRVVAKGADYLALKIRYVAGAHGVPIVERPPLARALYAQTDVGQEVHPEHYEAVAEILAYVYRLEGRMAS